VVKVLFLQTPGFPAQPFNAIPVHRFGERTGGNSKTCLHRNTTFGCFYDFIKDFIGKNGKHLSFVEKRLNGFPAFQAFGP
jgi:hypothetical protein